MEYQEFPKTLSHPAYRPAQKICDALPGGPGSPNFGFGQPEQWSPAMWPPVMVTNEDQEAQYLAKGYVPAGVPSPQAFSTAHASPFVAGRTVSKYPMMVNGVLVQDPEMTSSVSSEYPKALWTQDKSEQVFVNSEAEEKAFKARCQPVVAAEVVPPELKTLQKDADIQQLRAELDAKGIPYDKRWGVKKLTVALI